MSIEFSKKIWNEKVNHIQQVHLNSNGGLKKKRRNFQELKCIDNGPFYNLSPNNAE